jgi:hypothetical protein
MPTWRRLRGDDGSFDWTTLPHALAEIEDLMAASPQRPRTFLGAAGRNDELGARLSVPQVSSGQINFNRISKSRAIPVRFTCTPISPFGASAFVVHEHQFRLVMTASSSPQSRNFA